MPYPSSIPKELINKYLLSLDISSEGKRGYYRSLAIFSDFMEEMELRFDDLTSNDLALFSAILNERYSPNYANYIVLSLIRFFEWHGKNFNGMNIASGFKKPEHKRKTVRRELSIEQANHLFKTALGDGNTEQLLRDYLIINLSLRAALRPSEIRLADISDISVDSKWAILHIKSNNRRIQDSYALLVQPVLKALYAYLDCRGVDLGSDEPLITSASTRSYGERISERSLREVVQRIFKRAEIPGTAGDYSMRHTAIFLAKRAGATNSEIQQLARLRGITHIKDWDEEVFFEGETATAEKVDLILAGHRFGTTSCVISAAELKEIASSFREEDQILLTIDETGNLYAEIVFGK